MILMSVYLSKCEYVHLLDFRNRLLPWLSLKAVQNIQPKQFQDRSRFLLFRFYHLCKNRRWSTTPSSVRWVSDNKYLTVSTVCPFLKHCCNMLSRRSILFLVEVGYTSTMSVNWRANLVDKIYLNYTITKMIYTVYSKLELAFIWKIWREIFCKCHTLHSVCIKTL